MGFLASLLPGVRDLRTPMTAGLLWLAVAIFVLAPSSAKVWRQDAKADAIEKAFNGWPVSLKVPIAIGAAYFLGIIALVITQSLTKRIGASMRSLLIHVYDRSSNRSLRLQSNLHKALEATNPISATARNLSITAAQAALSRVGVPITARLSYPFSHLIDSIKYSAPHLAINAPDLYQEYDRLRSEAELRVAVVPPLVCLAIVAPINGKLWIVLAVTLACVILEANALSQIRSANNILANAAYLDQLSLPSIQEVVGRLELVEPRPATSGEWIAALILALAESGLHEELDDVCAEALQIGDPEIVRDAAKYLLAVDRSTFVSFREAAKERSETYPQDHWKESYALILGVEASGTEPEANAGSAVNVEAQSQ